MNHCCTGRYLIWHLDDAVYTSSFKYLWLPQSTTQCWICKNLCPRHRWPRKTVTRLTTKGLSTPKFLRKVCAEEKNTKGLFLARGNRFQAPQHIIIITRQEESPKAHKDRKPIISLQNRFLSYTVHNCETQMLRMLPYSNVKYVSELKKKLMDRRGSV